MNNFRKHAESVGNSVQREAPSVQQAVCTCLAGRQFGVLDALKDHQGPVDKYYICYLRVLSGSSL